MTSRMRVAVPEGESEVMSKWWSRDCGRSVMKSRPII